MPTRHLLRTVGSVLLAVAAAATAALAVPPAQQGSVVAGGAVDSHADAGPQPLQAGVAEGLLRVPVGAPLGGYLRPPVAGEYTGDDTQGELTDWFPSTADDGTPLVTAPDETRTVHSPFTTVSAPSRGYYDSLITKVVALYDGEEWAVLVKTDLIGMLDEVVVAVRDRVLDETGIDLGDGLVMSATHSHGGPGAVANDSVRYFWAAMDTYQPELFHRLVDDLAVVVVDAVTDLVPARFGYATGQESRPNQLNSFRRPRSPWSAERVAMQDALRRRIGVLRVDEVDGDGDPVRPLAVVSNYAAHGIVFGIENVMFSGDALSAVEREVEAAFDTPVTAMLVQSVGGDVSPRADGAPRLQRIERFGKLLGPQVVEVAQSVDNWTAQPAISSVSQRVELSLDALGYEDGEYPYEWGAVQCNSDEGSERCIPAPPPGPQPENDAFVPQDTIISALRIGDAVLLAQPGEPLGEYGLRLIESSPFGYDHTFIWGYAQDHIGYLLPDSKEDWLLGRTEGTTTFWGWKLGSRLQDGYVELMAALAGMVDAPVDELEVSYFDRPFAPAVPVPSARPGRTVLQPDDIDRFSTTHFAFEGGDPLVDLPRVVVQRLDGDGEWEAMRRPGGKVMDTFYETQLRYRLVSGAHQWTVTFEAPKDWPAGDYRFVASGHAVGLEEDYEVASEAFTVTGSASLQISEVVRDGDEVEATLAYTPRPTNYRLVDAEVAADQPAPVRDGQVVFTSGDVTVVADEAVIEVRDGLPVAVYRAVLPDGAGGEVSASGQDRWGNTTP